jgi:membrane-associated phospholipid phosphatase
VVNGDGNDPVSQQRPQWTDEPRRHSPAIPLITGAALAALWLTLALLILGRHGAPTGPDSPALSFMVNHRTPALTGILLVITNLGGTLSMTVASLLTAAWLAWRRAWADVLLVVVAGTGALILVPVTKNLIGRVRPAAANQVVLLTNQAFPSGHALGSLTVIGAIAAVALTHLTNRWLRVTLAAVAALFVLAVGLSRLYLGVHWATDVIGGWFLGAAWLAVCLALHARRTTRKTFLTQPLE